MMLSMCRTCGQDNAPDQVCCRQCGQPIDPPAGVPAPSSIQVRVVFFTAQHRISGICSDFQLRLQDSLNYSGAEYFNLTDACLVDLSDPSGRLQPLETVSVAKRSIIIACPVDGERWLEASPEEREMVWQAKVAHPAFLCTGPYEVAGTVHLDPEGVVGEAVRSFRGPFFAVTGATCVHVPTHYTLSVPVALIRREALTLVSLAPESETRARFSPPSA